jgi:hypothetical protein
MHKKQEEVEVLGNDLETAASSNLETINPSEVTIETEKAEIKQTV